MDPGASILDQAGEKIKGNSKQGPQNTFNEITAESPQSRQVVIQDQETYRTPNMTRKEPLPVKNSNQRKNTQSHKRKEPSYSERQTN